MNTEQLVAQIEKPRKHSPRVETRVTRNESEFMGIKMSWGVDEHGAVYLYMDTSGFVCTEITHKAALKTKLIQAIEKELS